MNKKILIIILVLILSFSLSACQRENQVINKDFNNSMWKDDSESTTLLFIENYLLVSSEEVKKDMEFEDLKDIKYENAKYKDIQIVLNDNLIEIRDEEGLIMEFEKLSDDKMKDRHGTVFEKRDIN